MAIEIVSFPINNMVIFHSYVTVYQRVSSTTPLHGQNHAQFSMFVLSKKSQKNHVVEETQTLTSSDKLPI